MGEIYEPQEDSYLLAGVLQGCLADRALDMGTGTGILASILAKNCKEVVAADINPEAVARARKGIKAENVSFVLSDLFKNVKGKFDLIAFNPPYLPGEEDSRFSCGHKAKLLKRFFSGAKAHLSDKGKIVFLLSSLTPIKLAEIRKAGYGLRKLAEKKLFFEKLTVYEAVLERASETRSRKKGNS